MQLSRWVASGRVIRIHKGWYTLAEPFRQVCLDTNVVAGTIKQGTYVSMQSALAYHGLIPEYVAETTCVTIGRPLQNPDGERGTVLLGDPEGEHIGIPYRLYDENQAVLRFEQTLRTKFPGH